MLPCSSWESSSVPQWDRQRECKTGEDSEVEFGNAVCLLMYSLSPDSVAELIPGVPESQRDRFGTAKT